MFSARRVTRLVDRHGIEIVHAHEAKDYLAGSIVRRAADNVRLVLTRHVSRPLKPFHRFALRGVDAAIGLTPQTLDMLRHTFAEEKIFSVRPGIELSDVNDDRGALGREFRSFHNVPQAVPIVVVIGELSQNGGQREALLAANEVLKEVPEAYFVIAGNDARADQRVRRELKRLARVLGIDGRCVWLNEPDDFSQLFAAADVMVFASHSGEPSRQLLEALAAGVPAIATASGGLLSKTAVVAPREPLALAKAVELFLNDPDVAYQAANEAQSAVRERFSVPRMADEVEAVYQKALGR